MPDEWVQIVDARNRPVRAAPRALMRAQGLRYRASFIYVFNQAGHVYLQKRAATKDMYPGWFDAAAGGVLRPGERYIDNAIRETEEELGVVDAPLEALSQFYCEDGSNRVWGQLFRLTHEGPFEFVDGEVDYGEFVDPAAILRGEWPDITPDSLYGLRLILDE